MHKHLIIFLSSIFPTLIYAQERTITGIVTAQNQRLSNAYISNVRTNTRTMSSDKGEFNILAKSGDTLITYKMNYTNDTLVVNSEFYLNIKLKQSSIALKEVKITASFKKSAAETFKLNKWEYREIYRKGDKSNMVVITPFGIGLSVDKIYNALSKEGRDARRLQKNLIVNYRNGIVDERFTKKLVTGITGYQDEKLTTFMEKNQPSFDQITKYSDYELIQYIKQKFADENNKIRKNIIDTDQSI